MAKQGHLSGSTDGKNIKVAATATPGTQVHQAVAAADQIDRVWLFASNTDTTARKLTIEFGGVTAPDDLIEVTIPPESGEVVIVAGRPIQNSLNIKAFAAAANVINIGGYVLRGEATECFN